MTSLSERLAASMGARESIGEASTLPWPVEEVGEGRGARLALTLAVLVANGFAGETFARVALDVVDRTGGRLEVLPSRPGIVKLVAPGSEAVDIACDHSATGAFELDPDDAGTAYFDAVALRQCIVRQGGMAFLFTADAATFSVAPIYQSARETEAPPFGTWLAGHSDAWLIREVTMRAASGSIWDVAVAVGIFARLFEPDDAGQCRQLGERLRTGSAADVLTAPRRWARALDDAGCDMLEAQTADEVRALRRGVTDLLERVNPDDRAWVDALVAICHRRDDLEAVRLLLFEARGTDVLRFPLGTVDDDATTLFPALPKLALTDERLRRVRSVDPDAWWAL